MSPATLTRKILVWLLLNPRLHDIRRRLHDIRRRLLRKPHVVDVFLQVDDPYSYLLSHYLPELGDAYDIELRLHLTQALGEVFRPCAEMLVVYAQKDCERLARELGLPFLDKGNAPPVEHRRALVEALAVTASQSDICSALESYWRGDAEAVARRVDGASAGRADRVLADNQKLLEKLGHYEVATLHHAGVWYWGVDRLRYLVSALDRLQLRHEDAIMPRIASIQQAQSTALPITPPAAAKQLPPLELFYSFRSPYSYLVLQRVYAIADAFGLQLVIRPVLPMIQRGFQVPRSKLKYILTDAAREADRLNIPFGRIAPPTGSVIDRCMSTYYYAAGERRERDFLLHLGDACWHRGIDVGTDKGLRKVTAKTGLFWPEVKAALDDDSWRPGVEANRESMAESGCWGVPTLKLDEFVVWGQDRTWLLLRHLEERCDAGEGILV
ncbi:MAG: DsbA family protein [Gammaproteobacteria bacterium]|nr:DsbA family protein [Gammaproteobacteria bacterium]